MTFFQDTGTILDATIDEVWEYLVSKEHGPAHKKSARKFKVETVVGSTATVAAERFFQGHWSRFVSKSTDFPPFCVCNEEIEGDFAGTKFVILYTPEGSQTRVDVYGDVRSPVFAPEKALPLFLGLLNGAYEDDRTAMAKRRTTSRR